MKKILSLILAAAMLLALCACGSSSSDDASAETAETETETETDTTATTETSDEMAAYDIGYAKYDPDTLVLPINGREVTWDEYYYWVSGSAYSLEYYYGVSDWGAEIYEGAGYTYNDYVSEYVKSYIAQIETLIQYAEENNITLTDEEQAQLDEQYESDVETYGGGDEAAFEDYLATSYISKDLYDKINLTYILMTKIYTDHYGENGELLTDEDVLSYAEENGYLNCKHILLSIDDEMTDEEKQEKYDTLQEIADELRASGLQGEELEAAFTEKMNERSEDEGGLSSYPDGYLFTEGTMVSVFEDTTKTLEEYEISDPVESSYGYHIIMRLPISPDDIAYGEDYDMRTTAADALFENEVYNWIDTAEIVFEPEFETLDLNSLFS